MQSFSQSILGFDFGYRRIGVAVGSRITLQARPLNTLLAKRGEPEWKQIDDLINTWHPQALVVGLPTDMNGTEQYTTHGARSFAAHLEGRYPCPVFLVDERLSTVEARSNLFAQGGYKKLKQSQIDSFAACVILEQWLSSC